MPFIPGPTLQLQPTYDPTPEYGKVAVMYVSSTTATDEASADALDNIFRRCYQISQIYSENGQEWYRWPDFSQITMSDIWDLSCTLYEEHVWPLDKMPSLGPQSLSVVHGGSISSIAARTTPHAMAGSGYDFWMVNPASDFDDQSMANLLTMIHDSANLEYAGLTLDITGFYSGPGFNELSYDLILDLTNNHGVTIVQ